MIGAWIESLNDEQRDRIIEHPDPTYPGTLWWDEARGCGCLVGCVVAQEVKKSFPTHERISALVWKQYARSLLDPAIPRNKLEATTGLRFPKMTRRFGAERMWRVVKARAAKRNRVNTDPKPRRNRLAVVV